jgi:hypothetical protein
VPWPPPWPSEMKVLALRAAVELTRVQADGQETHHLTGFARRQSLSFQEAAGLRPLLPVLSSDRFLSARSDIDAVVRMDHPLAGGFSV